ncbi:MAG: hypothetical protein ACTSR3_01360 [Candidatus Helarchaeota archaeon]
MNLKEMKEKTKEILISHGYEQALFYIFGVIDEKMSKKQENSFIDMGIKKPDKILKGKELTEKIFEIIDKSNKIFTTLELSEFLGTSYQLTNIHLNKLYENNKIKKFRKKGSSKVFWKKKIDVPKTPDPFLTEEQKKYDFVEVKDFDL